MWKEIAFKGWHWLIALLHNEQIQKDKTVIKNKGTAHDK